MNPYKIAAGTAQHIGHRAQQNDRAALFTGARSPGYALAVLADGVQGGALAAEQVLHTAKQLFDEFAPGDRPATERLYLLLRDIAREAHLITTMSPIESGREPHSTMVLFILTPHGSAAWAHVGDSRLYRFSNGNCALRTDDRSYVEHLVENDRLPLDMARNHRQLKLLSNLLGNRLKQPFVTVGSCQGLQAGDAFLLCSQGLWSWFDDAELANVITRNSPRQAAGRLIDLALARAQGHADNCTMAIIKLVVATVPSPIGQALHSIL
jgi:PPM family protein phosphatase